MKLLNNLFQAFAELCNLAMNMWCFKVEKELATLTCYICILNDIKETFLMTSRQIYAIMQLCRLCNIWYFLAKNSSRLQMFFKISVLQNFAIFPGKHLSWSLFLIRLQVFRVFYAFRGYRNISGMKWVNDECNRKAVVRRCSVKKVLLEISKNSQENTCASVSLLRKLQAQVFSCEFCEISKEIFS